MGSFGNSKDSQSGISQLWQNHMQVPRTKERTALLQREGGSWVGLLETNTPLEYTGSSKYGAFSLAEMWLSLIGWHVVGEEENRSSSCWDIKVVSLCKVHLFLLGLLLVSEKAWELPPLASWFHFKWGFLLLILIVMTWGYLQTSEQKTDREKERGEKAQYPFSVSSLHSQIALFPLYT